MINRIISYKGIFFCTGIGSLTDSPNPKIEQYLKNNYHKKSRLAIIIEIRDIIKRNNKNNPNKCLSHYYNSD